MENIHENGYWLYRREGYFFDEPLCNSIISLVKNYAKTIIDIGCGNGAYTNHFIKNGFECSGFDGNPFTPELTNNTCQIKDFSQFVDVGKFDVVLSLEVAEHIPNKHEQIFIDNLCRVAKNNIIMSWAVEGQGGIGHINCKNNDYVINEFKKRGYTYNVESSNFLRENSTVSWFKDTIMVFNIMN